MRYLLAEQDRTEPICKDIGAHQTVEREKQIQDSGTRSLLSQASAGPKGHFKANLKRDRQQQRVRREKKGLSVEWDLDGKACGCKTRTAVGRCSCRRCSAVCIT
jgi:hypothetical protein